MFSPLKNFFANSTKVPANIKRFFTDESGLFWLKFTEAQLSLSNEFVLKTESKKAASFEVAADIEQLRTVVSNRKQLQYIPAEANEVLRSLSCGVQDVVKQFVESFYEELEEYLAKWSRSLDGTEVFSWLRLDALPTWPDVESSIRYLQNHFSSDAVKIDKAFDEMILLQQVANEKLTAWNSGKVSCEDRWIDVFKLLNGQNRPIPQISLVAQYAFAIPGTSTEVERLFSIINGVWSAEKGHLALSTLEAHLNVKVNCNMNCEEFYKSVMQNNKLLAQVQTSAKYKNDAFEQPTTSSKALNTTNPED